jgi:predicted RNase H-like HicB family nuclease
MPAAACVIRIERLDEGRYRAVCTLLPDFEAVADTEDEARQAVEEAIRRHLAGRLGSETL